MYHSLFSHVPVRSDRHLDRYFKLIKHYVNNPHNGKGERHHILPVACEGEDSPLVLLPYRAHYVAHRMLWKAVGGAMTRAFHLMAHNKRYPDNRITSKEYGVLREEYAKHQSESMMGENNPMYGKTPSDEHRKKISESMMGHAVSDEARKKMSAFAKDLIRAKGWKHSDETKKKIGESRRGKKMSAESLKKMSIAQSGKTLSAEHKKNMSESMKLRWKIRKEANACS